MSEREAATKEPEYISPEKECITLEQIEEIRQQVNGLGGGITAKQFLENARVFASGGTVTSFNVTENLFDPPETVVPMPDFLKSLGELKGQAQHLDLEDVMFISKYILGKEEVDTTGLYQRVVLPHLPWRTTKHAAELVGNYGQPMTFIEEARRIAKEFNIGPNIAGEIANIAQQNKIPLRFLMPPDFKK